MNKRMLAVTAAVIVSAVGCAKRVDLDKAPLGKEVEITRQDGGVIRGALAARDDKTLRVTVGSASRVVPRDQIVDMRQTDEADAPLPAAAKFREFTVPEGTRLTVQLAAPVGSGSSRAGDPIEATLSRAISVNGTEVLPSGSTVRGTVAAAESSGKVSGRGSLTLQFDSISIAGRDERYAIAARLSFQAPSGKDKDVATIGLPAAGGALIGALVGGGKGAAIGAAVGGGAGTAVALSTRGPQVDMPRGTELSVGLDQAFDVRVPIVRK